MSEILTPRPKPPSECLRLREGLRWSRPTPGSSVDLLGAW
jgi:hypothetical protein